MTNQGGFISMSSSNFLKSQTAVVAEIFHFCLLNVLIGGRLLSPHRFTHHLHPDLFAESVSFAFCNDATTFYVLKCESFTCFFFCCFLCFRAQTETRC